MLEQFRMLEAALRLGEFTAAQLARESGVAEGTAQKTLQRHAELFDKSEGPRTGRPGGQPKLYKVRQAARSSLATAVQAAADEPELPPLPTKSTGEPLGLLLAEDTLLRILPRAARGERRKLLSAVDSQFSLAGLPKGAAKADSLQALHETLVTIVSYQEWLEAALKRSPPPVRYLPTWQEVLAAIECVLSINERQARQNNPERLDGTTKTLEQLALGIETISLSSSEIENTQRPPPRDILPVVRSLLLHPRWQDVIGDLPVRRLVDRLQDHKRVSLKSRAVTSYAYEPESLTPPDLDPGFRIRIVTSLETMGVLSVYSETLAPSAAQRPIGQIIALDLGLVSRTATRVIVAFLGGQRNEAMMFPYQTLRFGQIRDVVSNPFNPHGLPPQFTPKPTSRLASVASFSDHFGPQSPSSKRYWPTWTDPGLTPFVWFFRPATPHGVAIPRQDIFYGAKVGKVITDTIDVRPRQANVNVPGQIGGHKIGLRITLGADSRVDVYGTPYGSSDDLYMTTAYSTGLAQKVGELVSMDLDPNTGALINAYVQETISNHVNKVPFETLDYRTQDNCFVLHSVPETRPSPPSENPWARAYNPWTSNINKTPDLPTWIVPS